MTLVGKNDLLNRPLSEIQVDQDQFINNVRMRLLSAVVLGIIFRGEQRNKIQFSLCMCVCVRLVRF